VAFDGAGDDESGVIVVVRGGIIRKSSSTSWAVGCIGGGILLGVWVVTVGRFGVLVVVFSVVPEYAVICIVCGIVVFIVGGKSSSTSSTASVLGCGGC